MAERLGRSAFTIQAAPPAVAQGSVPGAPSFLLVAPPTVIPLAPSTAPGLVWQKLPPGCVCDSSSGRSSLPGPTRPGPGLQLHPPTTTPTPGPGPAFSSFSLLTPHPGHPLGQPASLGPVVTHHSGTGHSLPLGKAAPLLHVTPSHGAGVLAVWPWAGHLPSLIHSFLFSEMWVITMLLLGSVGFARTHPKPCPAQEGLQKCPKGCPLWLSGLRTQHCLCEDVGLIPGLVLWVKDPEMLQAAA